MKYIDADKLKAEIERRITDNTFGAKLELIDILAWLDTLSEEPCKSVEEAAAHHIHKAVDAVKRRGWEWEAQDITDAFVAGAEWQARQLLQGSPMPEDTVLFNKGVAEGRRLMMEDAVEGEVIVPIYEGDDTWSAEIKIPGTYNIGDKVRIVVLKKEEE